MSSRRICAASAGAAARRDERGKLLFADLGFEPSRGSVRLGFQLIAAGCRLAASPFRQIGIGVASAGAHGGAADCLLEACAELAFGRLTSCSDDDLGRNVAPINGDQLGHGDSRWFIKRRRAFRGLIAHAWFIAPIRNLSASSTLSRPRSRWSRTSEALRMLSLGLSPELGLVHLLFVDRLESRISQ